MVRSFVQGLTAVVGGCVASLAYAQGKSPDDCRAEVSHLPAHQQQQAVANCLYESVRDLEIVPSEKPATVPPKPLPKALIVDFGIYDNNSVGGVEPYLELFNPDAKRVIKYVAITAQLYNAVGDRVASTIGREVNGRLRVTGPLRHEDGVQTYHWEPVWYNSTGECVKITHVKVDYMNGQSETYSGKSLRKAMVPEFKNDCSVK